MTSIGSAFMPLERQLFPPSLGEIVAAIARQLYPRDTAKHLQRRWRIEPPTAANVVKGHVSERTLSKAIAAEGWALLAPLGEAMTGQSYPDHLQSLIEDTERARSRLARQRSHVETLMAHKARLERGAGLEQGR